MDYNSERVYLLDFPQFGKRIVRYEKTGGVIPLELPFGFQNELALRGAVSLHENGLIFQDQQLGSLFVPYSEAVFIKFCAVPSG